MTVPHGETYQAEVLRYIHDEHSGLLTDNEMGITRRIWNALGQRSGKNLASLSATLSALEDRGCIITDFGTCAGHGRVRISVMIVEEPPSGVTEYKERAVRGSASSGDIDVEVRSMPTPEEVARELLRLTVEAAGIPVTDIHAAQHHAECLQEEITSYVDMVDELEARLEKMTYVLRHSRRNYHYVWEARASQRREVQKANAIIIQLNDRVEELYETNERLADIAKEQERTIAVLNDAIVTPLSNHMLPGDREMQRRLHSIIEDMAPLTVRKRKLASQLTALEGADPHDES